MTEDTLGPEALVSDLRDHRDAGEPPCDDCVARALELTHVYERTMVHV